MTDKVVDEAKFRVEVNGLQPLIMGMEIELPSEEVIAVEFEYIKIKKSDCPIRDRNVPHVKDRKLGITQRLHSNVSRQTNGGMMTEEAINAHQRKSGTPQNDMRIDPLGAITLNIETTLTSP